MKTTQGKIPKSVIAARVKQRVKASETRDQRATRLYEFPGGPLIGWLFDVARQRNHEIPDMAAELGVPYAYIVQLMHGTRQVSDISRDFYRSCSRYLGISPIAVMILSESIKMSDFERTAISDEEIIENAIKVVANDPKVRQTMTVNLSTLALDAKKAIVLVYQQFTGVDFFQTHKLPNIVYWLELAAEKRDVASYEVNAGQRDAA